MLLSAAGNEMNSVNYYAATALDQSDEPVKEFDRFTNFLATIRYGKLFQMT